MRSLRISPRAAVTTIALIEVVAFAVAASLLAGRGQTAGLALTLVFTAVVVLATMVAAILLVRRERSRVYAFQIVAIAGFFVVTVVLAGALGWMNPIAVFARSLIPFAGILSVVLFDTGRATTWVDRRVTVPLLAVSFVVLVLVFVTSPNVPQGLVALQCNATCSSGWMNVFDAPALGDGLSQAYLVMRALAAISMSVGVVQKLRALSGSRRTEFIFFGIAGIAWTAGIVVQVAMQLGDLRAYQPLANMYALQFALRLLFPFGLCAGAVLAELRRGTALEDGFTSLRAATSVADVRDDLRSLLEDRSLDIAMAGDDAPPDVAGRGLTELRSDDGRLIATVVHGPALSREMPAAYALGMPAAASALEHIDLTRQMTQLSADVAEARAHAVAAGDAERARIERNLHDGAQARIVLLRSRLNRLARDSAAAGEMNDGIRELGEELDALLAEVRSLSAGLRPLRPGSLVPSLRDYVAELPLVVSMEATDPGAVPDDVEVAVYFCIRESLQNVVKHAGIGARAVVTITRDGDRLVFSVDDDGPGVPADGTAALGSGIAGMKARMQAVGGTLEVRALGGGGTRVAGEVSVQPAGRMEQAAR